MEVQQKCYIFKDKQGVADLETLGIIVNDRLFEVKGVAVKAQELFVKVNVYEDMLVGYSPLEKLEVGEDGYMMSGGNKICFVNSAGNRILLSKIRNKMVQWNDKDTTEEIDVLFEALTDAKATLLQGDANYVKLKDAGYSDVSKGEYTFLYKEGAEPYLFMETNETLSLMDINEVYGNEDSRKYKILNNGKELVYDVKARKISIA